MKKLTGTLLLITLLSVNCFGYGSPGHALIGRVADKLLAGHPTATKVSTLLNGMSLAQAAVLADDIKNLDNQPPGPFHLVPEFAAIESQMRAFWQANQPSSAQFFHRNFHFTDVPVVGNETYSGGTVGRSDTDIVHMMNFCIAVLQGHISENNARRITKPVAIILLAHYVGDIHQPLHVGAEYFNSAGQIFEPTPANKGFGDRGGNQLTLFLLNHGHFTNAGQFHAYWDNDTVARARVLISREIQAATHNPVNPNSDQVETWLATHEPANWRLPAQVPVSSWAESWANDIMPLARQAHQRLIFSNIVFQPHSSTIATGRAREASPVDGVAYQLWAARIVEMEMHKAGWRLAALLAVALN
ncbi:MAG TPA: S1/P1 nuclease [Pyrinomonadaceae bacterium]|nr:S1/P1 nuclease [Pyrinomonadaceae bacterium]